MKFIKDIKIMMFVAIMGCNIMTYLFALADMKVLSAITVIISMLFLRKCLWGLTYKKILKQDIRKVIEEEIEEALRGNITTDSSTTYENVWEVNTSIPKTKK